MTTRIIISIPHIQTDNKVVIGQVDGPITTNVYETDVPGVFECTIWKDPGGRSFSITEVTKDIPIE